MNPPSPERPLLATNAPEIDDPPYLVPTGNLWVSLADIDATDGSFHSLGVLIERSLGLVEADGGPGGEPLLRPWMTVDGEPVALSGLAWRRQAHWLPVFTCDGPGGVLEGRICAPTDARGGERGVALRLVYRHTGRRPVRVGLGWSGRWATTSVTHLRPKTLGGQFAGLDDAWTGARTVSFTAGLPLVAIAWLGGEGVAVSADGDAPVWHAGVEEEAALGGTVVAHLFLGVSTETDGASTTALHLRRRGFEALWESSADWLDRRALPVAAAVPAGVGSTVALDERVNTNLFFNFFFAQGDCLDTGRSVLVTSRSRRYYVAAAFWSRDAFSWTFPALLLCDRVRARRALVSSLEAVGTRVADHALYLNGTPLYPGFELDQAAAPILAVWRYVQRTGDVGVLDEPAVRDAVEGLGPAVAPWRHADCELYGTFLLPTDDPTAYPYVTTANALLAAAFEARASLFEAGGGTARTDAEVAARTERAAADRARALAIRTQLVERLTVEGPFGRMWAWACDAGGATECRDEPPLGLRTLPYWGLGHRDDPLQTATRRWLDEVNPHHYRGNYPGSGAAHFPHPSGFDLANRLLDGDMVDGDPLEQFGTLPLDYGLACESWDADSGSVRTGAAMASMAGLLAWTAWEHLSGRTRWDQPAHPG